MATPCRPDTAAVAINDRVQASLEHNRRMRGKANSVSSDAAVVIATGWTGTSIIPEP
ncbi:hypothetical protein PWG15_06930 [Ensifer adhaerens]|uniref:hypothetical protein n=1 Tax=Ensifer adhaerens TaxID=106592 RepID=UPI0023A95EC7|nr:hypothetical protein [Ensifer adhaerens]WDZ78224.1 hypothetical protein PWG15_06930 [Ensifer adhaerens]